MATSEIQSIVGDFVDRLAAALEQDIIARLQANVAAALGMPVKRGPGRPPKNAPVFPSGPALATLGTVRRKRPRQLCPVPGCTNTAAPIFGMVCADHKDVSKAKIREYREARKVAKSTGASKSVGRKAKAKAAAKPAKAKATAAKGRKPRSAAKTKGKAATKATMKKTERPAADAGPKSSETPSS